MIWKINLFYCKQGIREQEAEMEKKKGIFKRLVSGLTKTRDNIVSGMDSIFQRIYTY